VAQSNVRLTVDGRQPLQVIAKIRQAVAGLDAGYKKLQASANQAGAAARRFASDIERQTRALREQTKGVQGLVGAYAGFRTLQGTITAAVELESAQKRAELLTQRFSQLSGIQVVAAQSAEKFRLAQSDTLVSLIDLGNRLGPQGASLAEIKDVYEGFNTILAINKVTTQEAASAQLQLNQALGSGRLAGDEFRSVNEATPQVIDAVAKILKVARGEVKDLAAEGKVTAPVLIQALQNIKKEGADELEKSFNSTAGRLREFQKAQKELAQAVGTELLPAFTPLIRALTSIIKGFLDLPGPVKAFTGAIVGLTASFIALAPAIRVIIPLLRALGAAKLLAAGPWVAAAAGVAALTIYLTQATTASQRFQEGVENGSITVEEGRKKVKQYADELAKLEVRLATARGPKAQKALRAQITAKNREIKALTEAITGIESKVDPSVAGISGVAGAGGKKGKAKKERESRVPELTRELGLLRSQGDLQARIAEAEIAKNENEIIRLNGIQRGVELLHEAAAIQASDVPQAEKKLQLAAVEEKLNQSKYQTLKELAALDLQQRQTGIDRLQDLNDEQELLKARLNGNEAEVILKQQIRDIMKNTKGLSEEDVRLKLESINADKKRLEEAEQLKQLYSDIGMSIKSGVVEAITSAVEGTKTLGEVAGSVLKNIANKLLDVAINFALFGALSGTGSGGGLLGGLFKGRATGGTVTGGKPYVVGERGPELFMPGRSGSIIPNNAMGGANVTVNVDASGSNVEGNADQANQLGKAIGLAVQQELIKQKRPGGLLAGV